MRCELEISINKFISLVSPSSVSITPCLFTIYLFYFNVLNLLFELSSFEHFVTFDYREIFLAEVAHAFLLFWDIAAVTVFVERWWLVFFLACAWSVGAIIVNWSLCNRLLSWLKCHKLFILQSHFVSNKAHLRRQSIFSTHSIRIPTRSSFSFFFFLLVILLILQVFQVFLILIIWITLNNLTLVV